MLKHTLATFAALTVAATATHAQAKPDFSGQWEMNVAKSDFGMLAGAGQAPSKITMTVTQTTTTMKVAQAMTSPQGEINQTSDYTLDGKEAMSNAADGQPQTMSAKMDGNVLVINAKFSREGADITRTSRWTMSPDGKSLTIDQALGTPMGPLAFKVVFDKK